MRSLLIIKKATLQSYIDLLVKVALNLTTFFQVLKIRLMLLVLLNLTFQSSSVTLMQDQNLGGRMIQTQVKVLKLMLLPHIMAYIN